MTKKFLLPLTFLPLLIGVYFLILHNAQYQLPKNAHRVIDRTKPTVGLVRVARVVDGDTIEIEGGEHVRYIGMNTPETVDPRRPVQCFGKEASNKNKELVEGKDVRLEKDISERDKFGRLLRYVYLDKMFVNLELVKEGYAYATSYPPDIKYQDLFRKAEREAREQKRGLWRACR